MSTLRRWWRAFTSRLHDHSDDDCADCIAKMLDGYWMRQADEKAQRKRAS